MSEDPRLPIIVIGAGPTGLYAAGQLARRGLRPVIIDQMPAPGGCGGAEDPDRNGALARDLSQDLGPFDPLYLLNRRAASIWGSWENGFSVETDTGETITGAAVIYAGGAGALKPVRAHDPAPEGEAARRAYLAGCVLTPELPTGLGPIVDKTRSETALPGVFAANHPTRRGTDALSISFAEARRAVDAIAATVSASLPAKTVAKRPAPLFA